MFYNAITFLSGIMLLQNFSSLPSIKWAYTFFVTAFMGLLYKPISRYMKLPAIFIIGFSWCVIYAHWQSTWVLPADLEGKTIKITGFIADIPTPSEHRTSFLFSLNKIESENKILHVKGFLHLSWQDPKQQLIVGDQWKFSAHLKKIHGTSNPGGFDYEAWSLQEGIRANGYIYHDEGKLLTSHWYHYPLIRMRQWMYSKIKMAVPCSNTSSWIAALALGIRNEVTVEGWKILRNTGTNHLMAIAGLHIGFMCGFIYAVVNKVWRSMPILCLRFPAQHAGGLAAVLMAVIYSMLAGFSLPTQRACFMVVIFFLISLFRRQVVIWHVWSLTLISVLVFNPLNVLTESFWLSFGAVALIIFAMSGRLAPTGLWWKWGRIQWVLTFGLIPLSLWFFQEFSCVSILANLIAIPWVGFLIVPCIFLGMFVLLFSMKYGSWILMWADKLLIILWKFLTYLSSLSWAVWYHTIPNLFMLLLACISVVVLLVPVGFPGRWFGLLGLMVIFLYQPLKPAFGEAWLTLLDVGQGLSTVIQTQNHIAVFDTGPHLSDEFDMGESVVTPFLHTLEAKKIDMMIISHADNDHSGGAQAVIHNFPVINIKTSSPALFSHADYCLQHQSWKWDGIDFTFLYPTKDQLGLDNDSSCVLKISTPYHTILLPGDIEKLSEKYLVAQLKPELKVDILIAPHHGSKTSASKDFVKSVHPNIILFPVGYRNRYHFPNPKVINQYKEMGTEMYDSVNSGAILIKLTQDVHLVPIVYRAGHSFYWNSKKE